MKCNVCNLCNVCNVCIYVCMYVYNVCMYACMYVCMCVMYVCNACTYAHIYACMYVCMYVLMYISRWGSVYRELTIKAGNKCDLNKFRAIDFKEAKCYAEENELIFMETSASSAKNINEIFMALGQNLIKNNTQETRDDSLKLQENPEPRPLGSCCIGWF